MSKPNFFIIGAAKAGTSSLHRYIAGHPAIYMSPIKEPHFFSYEDELEYSSGPSDGRRLASGISNRQDYAALFENSSSFPVRGEASTTYLDSAQAPRRIRQFAPDAKIVVVLRDPVERAYASYMHLRREGLEPYADFAKALEQEPDRVQNRWGSLWHYKMRQFTHEKLKRYFDTFERSRIRIYLYDEWKTDNLAVLRDIFEFLDIDSTFAPDVSVKDNVGGVPKSESMHRVFVSMSVPRFLRPVLPRNVTRQIRTRLVTMNLKRPDMSPVIREQLRAAYREDILKVQDLVQRDLSQWL